MKMPQQNKLGIHATNVFVDEQGYTNIIYHNTIVVKFNEKEIILNSGGFRTATTKTRMNQASNQFRLGFDVYQKDFEWYVFFAPGQMALPFEDKMSLPRTKLVTV
jgi:hypothetical protein